MRDPYLTAPQLLQPPLASPRLLQGYPSWTCSQRRKRAEMTSAATQDRHRRPSASPSKLSLLLAATLLLTAAFTPFPANADALTAADRPRIPGVNFDFSVFDQFENGFDRMGGALTLFWTVENAGTNSETLHGALMFNGTAAVTRTSQRAPLGANGLPTLLNSWFAVAFGRSMLAADFLLVYINMTGGINFFNLSPTGNYQTPITNPGPRILVDAPKGQPAHISFNRNGIAMVEFRRLTLPRAGDSSHVTIVPTDYTELIWAYNINPDSTPATTWATYHGLYRGAYRIRFSDGDAERLPESDVGAKRIHGIGMFVIWQFIFPLGIYWARYAKSIAAINAQWMWVHIGLQVLGTIGICAFSIQRPHPIIGFTLLAGVAVQVLLGVLNRLGLQIDSLAKYRPLYRGLHDWFGRCLLILSVSQVALGINTLWPWPDALPSYTGRGFGMWLAYFFLTGAWLIAFFVTEVYWVVKVNQKDRGLSKSRTGRGVHVNDKGVDPSKALLTAAVRFVPNSGGEKDPLVAGGLNNSAMTLNAAPGAVGNSRAFPGLKAFTWADIDSELQQGNLYVVANGRFVYDIQKWIWSHPGGQIILYSVAGTDITNDYFHEAGFDAEAFVPSNALPALRERRRSALPRSEGPIVAPGQALPPPPSYTVQSAWSTTPSFPSLTEAEWRQVVKARRPHVHSRLAIEKLSTLLVGELVGDNGFPLFVEGGQGGQAGLTMFSPDEYRRYAIVETVIESGAGTNQAVFRVKFCTLYPHDTRLNEPKVFIPGQCVEIQARVNNKYVSRYFTPISGNPACFEVLIKLEPQGALTPFLVRQKPGDRQIRVRGPFGTPAVNPERPFDVTTGEWAHRRLVFITAGSGLAPALQMVAFLFLPTYVPVYAYQSYEASNPDEISVYAGDWVIARTHLLDGWAEGINLRTNQEGIFPLPITYPRCGPVPMVSILQSIRTEHDSFGGAMLQGAMLAYPEQLKVTTTITRGHGGANPNAQYNGALLEAGGPAAGPSGSRVPGQRLSGRITQEMLTQALEAVNWPSASGQYGGAYGMDQEMALSRIIVCGPRGFEGYIYETLVDVLGVPHQNITMLPDNQYL
ncbi:hypothetical protein HDU96_009324 [Phlyctochytrium bullatum]|nr:hypothetical protein HDU96_009324 [Phlyctochytrium bullatum]